jgi:predicted MFS family arabinose efflux permease
MPSSLLALCFGNFIIGAGALVVPGMLPVLAEGLEVSLPVAGQLISAFAFTVCVSAPFMAGATSRYDRRKLLVAVQLLYFGGHLAAALLSSFSLILLARVVTAVGAGLFTAQAAATAALLVPPERRGRAIAFVFLGWSISSVVGVSLGAYISATFGWRWGFALVALGALAGAALVWRHVPAGLNIQPVNARMWREILGNKVLLAVVAVTLLQSVPQFVVISYIVPAIGAFIAASPAMTGVILAAFGMTGVLGNVLAARFVDRVGPHNLVLAAMLSMLASHLIWPWSAGALPVLLVSLFLWGIASFAANSAQQARLSALAPQSTSVSIAMNSSALYLGQAIGTGIGGLILAAVPGVAGFTSLSWASVPLFLLAIAVSGFASRLSRPV